MRALQAARSERTNTEPVTTSDDESHFEAKISLAGVDPRLLFGQHDHHLRMVESQFPVQMISRGEEVSVRGKEPDVVKVVRLFDDLVNRLEVEGEITQQYLQYAIDIIKADGTGPQSEMPSKGLLTTPRRGTIKAKTLGQASYLEAIEESDIVFVIGPAGTGKTSLAVAAALMEFKRHSVERSILVRPAVEAGESLGFLPGDFRA